MLVELGVPAGHDNSSVLKCIGPMLLQSVALDVETAWVKNSNNTITLTSG